MGIKRRILGIDPGLANTGWGVVEQNGYHLSCVAYGCVTTKYEMGLAPRLAKIYEQIVAVIEYYQPTCLGIETVWFGNNAASAFATGQARGAALVACAQAGLRIGEYPPAVIKAAVVGSGNADKAQVQYMMKQILKLDEPPKPDHSADALAAAICFVTHEADFGKGVS